MDKLFERLPTKVVCTLQWIIVLLQVIKGFNISDSELALSELIRNTRFRNQAEMVHTCRGTISLHGAFIHTEDSCSFVITNGGAQTFHIRAATEIERQTWVTALELAKAKAMQEIETDGRLCLSIDIMKFRLLCGCHSFQISLQMLK